MKTLACGELVPGCAATIQAETEDEILAEAGRHAVEAHGLEVTPELVAQVRAHIRDETTEPAGGSPRGAGT